MVRHYLLKQGALPAKSMTAAVPISLREEGNTESNNQVFGMICSIATNIDRVAAVVHHGGAGTTTTAARAGAPQVVIPQVVDQPYWAGRVADLGIGTAHDGRAPTTGSLSAALRAVLTPQTRARTTAVAATIRTDGATVAATLLADAVSRNKPPVSARTTRDRRTRASLGGF